MDIIKQIFPGDRETLLYVRPACSADSAGEAEEAGELVDLPLRWIDVTREHLESVPHVAVGKRMRKPRWSI
jgi:hypothetical protein